MAGGTFKDFENAGGPLDRTFEPSGQGVAELWSPYKTDGNDFDKHYQELKNYQSSEVGDRSLCPLTAQQAHAHDLGFRFQGVKSTGSGPTTITPVVGMPTDRPVTDQPVVWFERQKPTGVVLICFANPRDRNNLQQVKRKATDADKFKYHKEHDNFMAGEGHIGGYVSNSKRKEKHGDY